MYRLIVTFMLLFFCVPLWAGTIPVSFLCGDYTLHSTTFTLRYCYIKTYVTYYYEDDVTAIIVSSGGFNTVSTTINVSNIWPSYKVFFFRNGYKLMERSGFGSVGLNGWVKVSDNSPPYKNYAQRCTATLKFPSEQEWAPYKLDEDVLEEVPGENVTEDDLRIYSMIFGALLFIPFSRFMRP